MKTFLAVLFILALASPMAFAQAEVKPDSILVEVWVALNFKSAIVKEGEKEVFYETKDQGFVWKKNGKGSIEFLFLTTERNKELAKAHLPGVDLREVAVCYLVRDRDSVIRAVYPLPLTFPGKCPAKWTTDDVPYVYGFFLLNREEEEIVRQ